MNDVVATRLDETDALRPSRIPWSRLDTRLVLLLLFYTFLVVGLYGQAYPKLSPIDELVHLDYAVKAGNLEVVNRNELVGQQAMSEAACRGMDTDVPLPNCSPGATYETFEFPEHGINTASTQNPPYYFVSGVGGKLIRASTPISSDLASIRLTGALWFAAGFAAMWALAGEVGIPRGKRAPVFGLLLATPQVVFAFSTLGSDNAILAASSLIFLTALLYERKRLPWWSLLVVASAAMTIERTTVLAVFAAGTYLILRTIQAGDYRSKQALVGPSVGMSAVLLWFGLAKLHNILIPDLPDLAYELPRVKTFAAEPDFFTGDLLLRRVTAFVTPIDSPYTFGALDGQISRTLLQLTSWLLVGGAVAAVLTSRRGSRIRSLTIASVFWLLAAGPILTIQWAEQDLPFQNRFGLPLLPGLVMAASWSLHHRSARVGVGLLALYSNAYMLFRLLF